MGKYFYIVLTKEGVCVAPSYGIEVGDLVTIKGIDKLLTVEATACDCEGGDFFNMMVALNGGPLPRIEKRYRAYDLEWED